MNADALIDKLGLEPLPWEGGYYRETWRSDDMVPAGAAPERYGGGRCFGTAIYYLLTPGTTSAMHRVASDEIFHFYLGDPVTMLRLHPDGREDIVTLGPDIAAGQAVQCIVPRGIWQGACLAEGGKFALMGCTVSPGLEFQDFELGEREELLARYPGHPDLIRRLTSG
jgi:hypothetical protein